MALTFKIFDANSVWKRTLRGSLLAAAGTASMIVATPASAQLATPYFTLFTQISPCNGDYRFRWSAISDATFYQVFSRTIGTTNYFLTASPTTAFLNVKVGAPGVDYKVQACNGTSCGAFSEPLTLTYYNGCD